MSDVSFKCRRCGNCCKWPGYVRLFSFEVEQIAEFLNLSKIYPKLGPFVATTYLEVLHKTPLLWRYVYDRISIFNATKKIKTSLTPFYSSKLQRYLTLRKNSAIVSTHALTSILLSKRTGELKHIPHFAVLTDYHAHNYWPSEGVDLYFAANKESKAALVKTGVRGDKIIVSGIPVRKEFADSIPLEKAKKNLGLNPKSLTVLLTGGTKGLGDMAEIFSELKNRAK